MKFHSIQLEEGSAVTNMTLASGTSFPDNPTEGELFYRSDVDPSVKGMYVYIRGLWGRIASADAITVPSGVSFPSAANPGDLFYINTNDSSKGLYVYSGDAWGLVADGGSGSVATVTGDVTGTLTTGSSGALTLATVSTAGTSGSASKTVTVTIDAKGRVTSLSDQDIAIAASQVTSGTFADARISETSVTQHQGSIDIDASQVTSGTFSNARVAQSNITQHQAALTILESQITDGAVLARVSGDETITGSWHFNNGFSSDGAITASNISGTNTGDQTITLTGDVTGSGTGSFATTITSGSVSNVKLASMPAHTFKGNNTGSTAVPDDLTAAELTAELDLFTSTLKGLVPGSGGGVTNFLRADGTWAAPVVVSSFNTRTGAVTLTSSDVTTALGFTPLSGNQTITVSGDATGSGTTSIALTLGTVNSNVGSFGSASAVPTLTVNGKGLVTAVSNTPIAIAASQVTSGTFADARIAQSNVTQHQAALTILESQITDGSLLARNAGNETITGTWTFNNAVTGATPTAGAHLATKDYVDNLATGLDFKASVRAATTANITLSGTQTVDGVALVAGNRVLVKDQTDNTTNGIYVVASGAWTRATDADNTPSNEVSSGMYCFVESGTTNADTGWVLTTDGGNVTLGTTALVFTQFTGLGQITAGTGLSKTGSTLSIANTGTAGTYTAVTTNAQGQVTSGANLTATGDVTGTASGTSIALSLPSVGTPVTSSFVKITTDAKGRVSGTTAVTASDITGLVDSTYVNVAGDTMTGTLNLPSNGLVVGTNQLVVSGGNVGIGISNPSARFQVLNGDNSNGAIRLSATGTTVGNFASMTYITGTASWGVGTEAGNGRFFIYNSQGVSDQLVFTGGSNSTAAINALGTGTIRLNTAGGNTRVLITDTGRVGIRTQTPAVTLDVAGDINASSSLNVGFNRASDGSAVLDLQAQGGTGIDYNARLQRASGVDGALTLTNAGNGGLVLQTEGNGFVNIRQGNTSRLEVYSNSQVFLTAANADNTTTLRTTTADRQIALSFTHGTPTIAATNFIGSAGAAGQLVADSGQYDVVSRTNGRSFRWSVNDGTSSALVLSSTGGVSINNSPVSNTKLFVNGSVAQNVVAVAASDINWSQGNYFTRTISTATTFTFSNFPASGFAMITLKITNGGSATVTWPTGTKWNGGVAPTLTAAGVDIISFFTDDGGTTIHAFLVSKDSK